MPVFLMSTIVNSPLGMWKDRLIATLYGDTPKPFPTASYSCFVVRDAIVIGVSFTMPRTVAPHIQAATGLSAEWADIAAQIVCPGLSQIFATPVHVSLSKHFI